MTIRRLLALSLLTSLGGCTTTQAINCPALVPYTDMEQRILSEELAQDGPETQAALEDYFKLRDACQVATPKRGALY